MKIFREPASGFSHLAGAILSIYALVALLYVAIINRSSREIVSYSIFGASMILLYSVSTAYHLFNGSPRVIDILRKLDHSMIFILIAGTYTPVCLILLKGFIGYTLFSIIWALTLVGIILEIIFFNKIPRSVSTSIYVLMGWFSLIAIIPLYQKTGLIPVGWLLAGGFFYTLGALIYNLKKPNLIPHLLGFHEIFHLFTMMGSASHFWMILRYCSC